MTRNSSGSSGLLTVYYDGACRVCSAEISLYQRSRGASNIEFVDICHPSFDAEREGLDPFEVHKSFHVRTADRLLHKGVAAFICIWDVLPAYHWLGRLARLSVIRRILEINYVLFTKIRPFLPRKKFACDGSAYCDLNNRSKFKS